MVCFKLLLFRPPSLLFQGWRGEVKGRAREEGTGGVCRLLPPADRHLHFSRLVGLESSRWWENSTITVERAALTLGCLHASLYSRRSSARSVKGGEPVCLLAERNSSACSWRARRFNKWTVGFVSVRQSAAHHRPQSDPMDVVVPCNQPLIH
jgi:hypothetical protein